MAKKSAEMTMPETEETTMDAAGQFGDEDTGLLSTLIEDGEVEEADQEQKEFEQQIMSSQDFVEFAEDILAVGDTMRAAAMGGGVWAEFDTLQKVGGNPKFKPGMEAAYRQIKRSKMLSIFLLTGGGGPIMDAVLILSLGASLYMGTMAEVQQRFHDAGLNADDDDGALIEAEV